MENTLTAKTFINDFTSLELEMRDILCSMEELANMIGISSSSYYCEILSIEPPCATAHNPGNHAEHPCTKHIIPAKAQVLPFNKK